jgi:ligand-binding SRPBCC domain-containing protein
MDIFHHSTVIQASPETVWARLITPAGINDEFFPYLRMNLPRHLRGQTIDDIPLGTGIGACWLLLFGLLPLDIDFLCLVEHEPGRRFLERSTMLSMQLWQHERRVEPTQEGCRIEDRIGYTLRWPFAWLRPLQRHALPALFAHRQRRLKRWAEARLLSGQG